MTKRNQDAKVYRGDSASIDIAVTHADGSPYDPTIGARLQYRVAKTSHSPDTEALVRKTSSVGGGITSTALGIVTIVLNPEDTDFPPGVYYHELKVFDAADVSTSTVGAFVIKKSIPMGERIAASQGNLVIDKKVPTRTP